MNAGFPGSGTAGLPLYQKFGRTASTAFEDGWLSSIIIIYEPFTLAFCEVLEIGMDDVRQSIPPERLRELAAEVGAEARTELI